MPNDRDNEIRCSFCGKTQDEVTRLVEGPGVYICDNCIEFCNALLFDDEGGAQKKRKKNRQGRARRSCLFCFKEPLNKSSAAVSGSFLPALRYRKREIHTGFLRF